MKVSRKELSWGRKLGITCLLQWGGMTYLVSQIGTMMFYEQFKAIYGLSNTQVGVLSSFEGGVCLIGNFLGGWFCDRFNPKIVFILAALTGALACIIEAFASTYWMLVAVYLLLGVAEYFFLNAATGKLVRFLGKKDEQGRLLSWGESFYAIMSLVFNYGFLGLISALNLEFQQALLLVAGVLIAFAVLCMFFIKIPALDEEMEARKSGNAPKIRLDLYIKVLKMPAVWFAMMFILGQNMYYQTLFGYMNSYLVNVSLFAAASASALVIFLRTACRVVVAPIGGTLRDKLGNSTKLIIPVEILMAVLAAILAFIPTEPSAFVVFLVVFILAAVAMFSINGLQSAMATDAGVPVEYTGTFLGVAYCVGWSHYLYRNVIIGGWLDNHGLLGYRYMYLFMVGCALLAMTGAILMNHAMKKQKTLSKEVYAELEAGTVSLDHA